MREVEAKDKELAVKYQSLEGAGEADGCSKSRADRNDLKHQTNTDKSHKPASREDGG